MPGLRDLGRALPPAFRDAVAAEYGAAGMAWLDGLGATLRDCVERLGVRPTGEALWAGSPHRMVLYARWSDGTPAVMKLSLRREELALEARALERFAGHGAVRLLAHLPEHGALVVEGAVPGDPIDPAREREAMDAVCLVLADMWAAAPDASGFPTVADRAAALARLRARFGGGTGPFPRPLVSAAEGSLAELLADAPETRLLHGDLPWGNVLRAGRRPWLAIDPAGVVGERAYEVGYLVSNVGGVEDVSAAALVPRLRDRLDRLPAMLGVERRRVAGYALAQAVLSAWKALEERRAGWDRWLRSAEAVAPLLRG